VKKELIFYRGPLERSRLSFIIESVMDPKKEISFTWVFPGKISEEKKAHAETFLSQYNFAKIEFRGERFSKWIQTNLSFRRLLNKEKFEIVHLIGFSAPLFSIYKGRSRRVWYVNGIPEEKEMHTASFFNKMMALLLWKFQGWASKASLVVTVSSRMSEYVRKRTGMTNLIHVPTCTSLDTFRPKIEKERKYFTYLGSGAAWQALDWLEEVWYSIHQQDPAIQFRVISRDSRCKQLGKRIASSSIEFVASSNFDVVASYLHEAQVGFLLRKDTIVNRVCFPTKLGEYLAAGCWVVSSDIDWDVKDWFQKYNIGILVTPSDSPSEIAKSVLKYYSNYNINYRDIETAAAFLEKNNWISKLKQFIK
jgi:glycosyltransferase involved in cell wall biosynthesis